MAIDLHCHIFPPEYLRLARTQGERIGARIYRRDDGREFIRAPGDFDYPLTDDLWSVPALVAALERRHLTGAALSVAPPTLSYGADPGLAADLCAASNDSIAEVVRGRPDRFIGLATALSWLVGEIGSDHVVVGSDYPFDIGPDDPTEIIREAPGLTAEDRENILRRTAWKLLGVEIGREP